MKLLVVAAPLALLGLGLGLVGVRDGARAADDAGAAPAQPIAFSHARHADELDCLGCHPGAATGPYAGLPKVDVCLLCHAEPQGDHPDEPRIAAFKQALGGIPWVQMCRVAGHVYFSHEAHVTYAEMDCSECHGDVAALTAPVAENHAAALTMKRCMDCHFERGATNDCLACHK